MPTYEYRCTACSHGWEEVQKISEPASKLCPSCKTEAAQRQISGGNFILKGGGWYADLYSSSKPKSSGSSSSSEGKTETKSESKTESTTTSSTPAATPAASSGSSSKD